MAAAVVAEAELPPPCKRARLCPGQPSLGGAGADASSGDSDDSAPLSSPTTSSQGCPLGHRKAAHFSEGSLCPLGYGRRSGTTSEAAAESGTEGRRGECYYGDYLQVARLLSCQQPASAKAGAEAHDELLFITTHQAYELWFKQILHELWSVHRLFSAERVSEAAHFALVQRLTRVVKIMRLLVSQFEVLETMTPMDFLSFREHLKGASGFQSLQFRTIEALLGVQLDSEVEELFENRFNRPDIDDLKRARQCFSLFHLVERWLERTPGLGGSGSEPAEGDDPDFWVHFQESVQQELRAEREAAEHMEGSADLRAGLLQDCAANEANYETAFCPRRHAELQRAGHRRLSHRAFRGAMLISLYRDEPRFHTPYQIISLLMDIDSLLAKWRYEHVMMVHRMIGCKVGTGGSSGYAYLRSTLSDKHRVFTDLFNLTTLLVPYSKVPPLTPEFAVVLRAPVV